MYDGEDLTLVYDETGTPALEGRYLHGPGIDTVLAYWQPGQKIRWTFTDRLGSVRDVVEISGAVVAVVEHQNYSSFGGITSDTNLSYDFRFGYTGRLWDADVGLQFNRARWYDPALGKFLSEDPLGFGAGDANLTRYVGNDPVNFTDPSGLFLDDVGEFFEDIGESIGQAYDDSEEWLEEQWQNPEVRAGVYVAAAVITAVVLQRYEQIPGWVKLSVSLATSSGSFSAEFSGDGSASGSDSSGGSDGLVIRGQSPDKSEAGIPIDSPLYGDLGGLDQPIHRLSSVDEAFTNMPLPWIQGDPYAFQQIEDTADLWDLRTQRNLLIQETNAATSPVVASNLDRARREIMTEIQRLEDKLALPFSERTSSMDVAIGTALTDFEIATARESQQKRWNRVGGGVQAGFGLAEAFGGVVLATGGTALEATGVGIPPGLAAQWAGGALFINGLDQYNNGMQSLITGESSRSVFSQFLDTYTGDQFTSDVIHGGLTIGAGTIGAFGDIGRMGTTAATKWGWNSKFADNLESRNWPAASLQKAISRHAGEEYTTWITKSGKEIYENPVTGRQVVRDLEGGYFRVLQPSSIGSQKGTYLNMIGDELRSARVGKNGIHTPLLRDVNKDQWLQESHFFIEELLR